MENGKTSTSGNPKKLDGDVGKETNLEEAETIPREVAQTENLIRSYLTTLLCHQCKRLCYGGEFEDDEFLDYDQGRPMALNQYEMIELKECGVEKPKSSEYEVDMKAQNGNLEERASSKSKEVINADSGRLINQ